ncbi:MAG: hypothetical protein J0M20_17915 [Burkholderiales bacterium]|nr:hypothetical protein [Burkholderiales bacterium]
MNSQPANEPTLPDAALPGLPGLGDWQASSQELRAGLFMQELHEDPLLFASFEPAHTTH